MNGKTRNESAIPENLEKCTAIDNYETLKVEMLYKPSYADNNDKKVNFSYIFWNLDIISFHIVGLELFRLLRVNLGKT